LNDIVTFNLVIASVSGERSPLIEDNQTNIVDSAAQSIINSRRLIIASCFAVRILYLVGSALIEIPLLQIQESILCDSLNPLDVSHLGHSHLPEPDPRWRCKQENVQRELSILQSWSIMAQLIPSLIVSVPLGLAADRYGRTVILGLGLLGVILYYGLATSICR
jgi:MFS family permease